MSNMEEIDLREYDEERELFTMLDIDIPNIKMKSDDRFYIDLYDDDEDMEDLDEEEEEEDLTIWSKCEQFYKIWSQQWIMMNIKSMSIYMSSGVIFDYAHKKEDGISYESMFIKNNSDWEHNL